MSTVQLGQAVIFGWAWVGTPSVSQRAPRHWGQTMPRLWQ
jgi:hypothetical protein